MNGGSRIIDLRPKSAATPDATPPGSAAAPVIEPAAPADDTAQLVEKPTRGLAPWLTVAAALATLAWAGGMLWLARDTVAALSPVALVNLIAALCVPPTLIGVLLLLAFRTRGAEVRRFVRMSLATRAEAVLLDRSLAALTERIENNRLILTEQVGALTALGDTAVAHVASIGTDMAGNIAKADAHAAALAAAADGAHQRLDLLLGLLPRARADTEALTTMLESSRAAAAEHATALDTQLALLAERARDTDAIAAGTAKNLAAYIARMEAGSGTAAARLEQVSGDMAQAVDTMIDRTADAVAEAGKRIAAQGDAMVDLLGTNQAALDATARASADRLAARVAEIEAMIERIGARLALHSVSSTTMMTEIDEAVARVSDSFDTLQVHGVDRMQALHASFATLGGSTEAMTAALKSGDGAAASAMATVEQLLLALDSAARDIDETLPKALTRLDARIAESRATIFRATPDLLELVSAAESTQEKVATIADTIVAQRDAMGGLATTLMTALAEGEDKASALGGIVDEAIGRTHRFVEEAAPRLIEALLRVRDTASAAAERARDTLATVIPEAAQALERHSAAALERATGTAVAQQISEIGQAAETAADAAARASERLTRQMLAISDATAIVESRLEEARVARENADQDTLPRRVSLLIESLNSASIDISKAFSRDVSDSAWSAYLKGDRGVFTRRAVRLLDAADVREIARLHEIDPHFREQVNRYIHDFEAMLRAILSQRDGSPLGVTLLSSDMGKLYVMLAQAIERLRA